MGGAQHPQPQVQGRARLRPLDAPAEAQPRVQGQVERAADRQPRIQGAHPGILPESCMSRPAEAPPRV